MGDPPPILHVWSLDDDGLKTGRRRWQDGEENLCETIHEARGQFWCHAPGNWVKLMLLMVTEHQVVSR
jgi:hypothetical protein